MRAFFASAALCLLASAPAFAATDLSLPPFSAIEAHGGAHVVFHHGASQRVTVVKGDMKVARIIVVGGKLEIDPCPTTCWIGSHELDVDVVSPGVQALAAHGGARIDAEGTFPKQPQMSVEAHGGGSIDIRTIPADAVSVEAHGGGNVRVRALAALSAEAHGGGDIVYAGNPPKVAISTHGGGSIRKE